jgi:hypothetical protein
MSLKEMKPSMRVGKIATIFGYSVAGAAFSYVMFSLAVYAFPALREWQSLAFTPIQSLAMRAPTFADLAMLTHSSRCEGSLTALYDGSVRCDPYKRLFTYPPMALWMFQILGLSAGTLGWVGFLLGGSVALAIGIFFFAVIPSPLVAGVSLALGYLSLPFMLALERANNDLIVFLLLMLLALSMASGKRLSAAFSGVLALLAVATKILPLFGIAATYLLQRQGGSRQEARRRNSQWALTGAVVGLSLVLPWLPAILRNSPSPSGEVLSHGLLALQVCYDLMVSLKLSLNPSRIILLGCAGQKLIFLFAGFIVGTRKGFPASLRAFLLSGSGRLQPTLMAISFSLFSATWVGTYLTTKSYDYKFIFLLPAFAITASLLTQPSSVKARPIWIILVLVPMLSAWFIPYLSVSFNQPLGTSLELVNDFVLIPLLAGSLSACLPGCRGQERAAT